MKFTAKLQQMAASEIMDIIPENTYRKIKQRDSSPLFQAYIVGHEGEVTAQMVGIGKKALSWFSSAINRLWEKLEYGTKVFHGHNLDSSHEGRQSIGEVVGKAIKTIQDKVNAIAITYIYPEYKGLSLNIASIEADVRINPDDSVHDIDVENITGIALGDSAIEKPGFAGATLLSQIQAFIGGGGKMTISAKTLEEGINEKYGKNSGHKIDENISLIRKMETGEIVILDSKSAANGHHLLKDASQEEIDKIAGYFKKLNEKEEEKADTSYIPGEPDPEPLTEEEKKETDHIPGDEPEGISGDSDEKGGTDHIPD